MKRKILLKNDEQSVSSIYLVLSLTTKTVMGCLISSGFSFRYLVALSRILLENRATLSRFGIMRSIPKSIVYYQVLVTRSKAALRYILFLECCCVIISSINAVSWYQAKRIYHNVMLSCCFNNVIQQSDRQFTSNNWIH